MKVYVVIEDGEFKCDVIGVYMDKYKALKKKIERTFDRDIIECEVEENYEIYYDRF